MNFNRSFKDSFTLNQEKSKISTFILASFLFLFSQYGYSQIDRSHEAVIAPGSEVPCLLNSEIDNLVGFSFNGTEWVQVPIQIDERAELDFSVPYDHAQNRGTTNLFYTDENTFTGADPFPLFDEDDEILWMFKDMGLSAAGQADPAGVQVNSACRVTTRDPITFNINYIYIYLNDGSLQQDAGVDYVEYNYNLLSGDYITTYNTLNGPNLENSTISSEFYSSHFSDRWIRDELFLYNGVDTTEDILDRHKNFYYPSICNRTEDSFSEGGGCMIANINGPIRAVRSYMGANSGPYTTRTNFYYERSQFVSTHLRVHRINAMFDVHDYTPAIIGTDYFNAIGDQFTIDGVPDNYGQDEATWEVLNFPFQEAIFIGFEFNGTFQAGVDGTKGNYAEDNNTNPQDTCTGDDVSIGSSGNYYQFNLLICTNPIGNACSPVNYRTFNPIRKILYGFNLITQTQAELLDSVLKHPVILFQPNCTNTFSQINAEDCDEYLVPSRHRMLTMSGTYMDTITNFRGCDSIITINLTILDTKYSSITATECHEYTSPSGKVFTTTGTYLDTIPSMSNICDSIITINLTIDGGTNISVTEEECNSYLSPTGKTYTSSGVYLDTIVTLNLCDTIITTNLTIYHDGFSTINPTECDSYTTPSGKVFTVTGTYLDTIPTSHSCDSIITINLTIDPGVLSPIMAMECIEYISPSGKVFTVTGMYRDTVIVPNECDTLFLIDLTIYGVSRSTINPTECDSYTSPSGRMFTMTGTYLDTIPSSNQCDSIITINLTIGGTETATIYPEECYSYTSPSGQVLTMTGLYTDTVIIQNDCDSIYTIDLTIFGTSRSAIDVEECDSYNSPAGNVYTATGTYLETIMSSHGCDSIITINLTIGGSVSANIFPEECYSYTAPSGQVLTTTGIYFDTVPIPNDCDSTYIIDLTIFGTSRSTINAQECDSYTSPAGNVYTVSGTYMETILTSHGCDSIITINLTIDGEVRKTIYPEACNSYVSPSGRLLTITDIYVDTVVTQGMCDTIYTIDLIIHRSSRSTIDVEECDSYTSPLGFVYTSTQTIVETIRTTHGCDSTITINLTIVGTISKVIYPEACYSYISPSGSEYTSSTVFTEIIRTPDQCDTAYRIELTIFGTSTSSISAEECESYTSPSGKEYNSSGIYMDTIPSSHDCDSIITIDLTISENSFYRITAQGCNSYTSPLGMNYSESGEYMESYASSNGCDSIVTIDLTIIDIVAIISIQEDTLMAQEVTGATYFWIDCNDNNIVQMGSDFRFVPEVSGSYKVQVESMDCIESSECIDVVIDDINEFDLYKVHIYPNPFNTSLMIENCTNQCAYRIFNTLGEVVYQGTESRIETSDWTDGLYLIRFENGESKKLIKY